MTAPSMTTPALADPSQADPVSAQSQVISARPGAQVFNPVPKGFYDHLSFSFDMGKGR